MVRRMTRSVSPSRSSLLGSKKLWRHVCIATNHIRRSREGGNDNISGFAVALIPDCCKFDESGLRCGQCSQQCGTVHRLDDASIQVALAALDNQLAHAIDPAMRKFCGVGVVQVDMMFLRRNEYGRPASVMAVIARSREKAGMNGSDGVSSMMLRSPSRSSSGLPLNT